MAYEWTNWSGSVTCHPAEMATPSSEEELAEVVRRAGASNRIVRLAGTGHSFVPLCATAGCLISLDELQGLESTNTDSSTATILAGTKIHAIGDPMREAGFSLANQGDIDKQSIAGAISTGTHGTGRGLGSISTQMTAARMVTADGEVREFSLEQTPDAMRAIRVSLGALGILSAVQLLVKPAYRLHERLWQVPIAQCLDELDGHIASNHHFEFFWYPSTDLAHMKSLNPTDEPPNELPEREGERIDHSARIFPTERNNKFNECEYAIPAERGPECFAKIRALMQSRHSDVVWPVEYRTVAADDNYLSPNHGRATVTLSIHQANTLPYEQFFEDAQDIFLRHQGRPHWGKMHRLSSVELCELYPQWDQFHSIRRELDPHGRFMNDHLRRIFGND